MAALISEKQRAARDNSSSKVQREPVPVHRGHGANGRHSSRPTVEHLACSDPGGCGCGRISLSCKNRIAASRGLSVDSIGCFVLPVRDAHSPGIRLARGLSQLS
jgi:hypothetical protein